MKAKIDKTNPIIQKQGSIVSSANGTGGSAVGNDSVTPPPGRLKLDDGKEARFKELLTTLQSHLCPPGGEGVDGNGYEQSGPGAAGAG